MPDTIIFLQLEHGTIARLLALVQKLGERIEAGEEPDFDLLTMLMEYFQDYPDACHHPKEDLVFRALKQRHPEAAGKLDDLLGDHRELEALTDRTAGLVSRSSREDKSGASRKLLAEGLTQFTREYWRHLRAEEEHFFPAASRHLTREDWDIIDFTLFDRSDPMYHESTESRFKKLRDLIWDAASDDQPRT